MLLALLRVGGDRGWTRLHKTMVGVTALLVLAAAGGLLMLATRVSARNREREGAMF
jgi:ABC-type transporter Mla subunit MlaD